MRRDGGGDIRNSLPEKNRRDIDDAHDQHWPGKKT